MQSKPQHTIPTIALAASIAISVAPVNVQSVDSSQDVRGRIVELRSALIAQGAELNSQGMAKNRAKFAQFENTHNKATGGCTERTC